MCKQLIVEFGSIPIVDGSLLVQETNQWHIVEHILTPFANACNRT